MRTALVLIGLAVACAAPTAGAQDWRTVHQSATWVSATAGQALGDRLSFWFEGHFRRSGFLLKPQQVLLRPGLQFPLSQRVGIGAGYAYVATAPYGRLPSAAPSRERRAWQQVSLTHSGAAIAISHRLRWEQRWLAAVRDDGNRSPFAYQQRARYALRAQRPLGEGVPGDSPAVGILWNELFVPVGHSDGRMRRLQNRVGIGIGIPLDARQRVEIAYMNQWNRVTPERAHEMNHTAVLAWVWPAAH